MRNILISATLFVCISLPLLGQVTILTFTGEDTDNNYVQLQRVEITNRSQDWEETIFYPDTILILKSGTGILTPTSSLLSISPLIPNPAFGTSEFSLETSKNETIHISICTILGEKIIEYYKPLSAGKHAFKIYLSVPQLYLVRLTLGELQHTFKFVNEGGSSNNKIEYSNTENYFSPFYISQQVKGHSVNSFMLGDVMNYVGYATLYGVEVSSDIITQSQNQSEDFTLLFDVSGTLEDTVPNCGIVSDIDGNEYKTVIIGNQCWMRENLRVTRYADGSNITLGDTANSSLPYRYYPNWNIDSVAMYGYLYNWTAATRGDSSFTNPSGVQGACPNGWHLPSDSEWVELKEYVRLQPAYQCNANPDFTAKSIAYTSRWLNDINGFCSIGSNQLANNATGFGILPAGQFTERYDLIDRAAFFWTTTGVGNFAHAYFFYYFSQAIASETINDRGFGYSVRCLKDN